MREDALLCFVGQVFSQMVHVGVGLTFAHVESVLSAAVLELERNKEKIANPGPKDDISTISVCNITRLTQFFINIIKNKFKLNCNVFV